MTWTGPERTVVDYTEERGQEEEICPEKEGEGKEDRKQEENDNKENNR
jgi:hypothetical protein